MELVELFVRRLAEHRSLRGTAANACHLKNDKQKPFLREGFFLTPLLLIAQFAQFLAHAAQARAAIITLLSYC